MCVLKSFFFNIIPLFFFERVPVVKDEYLFLLLSLFYSMPLCVSCLFVCVYICICVCVFCVFRFFLVGERGDGEGGGRGWGHTYQKQTRLSLPSHINIEREQKTKHPRTVCGKGFTICIGNSPGVRVDGRPVSDVCVCVFWGVKAG